MKKESNMISTKDELIKNFSKEQMEIYNYYKSKFSYNDQALVPVQKEDKELMFLEKGCNILSTIFKVQLVVSLVIITFVVMFHGVPGNNKAQVKYKGTSISTEIKYQPKI